MSNWTGREGPNRPPPHPATVAQPKLAFGGVAQRPPHPATVAQPKPAFRVAKRPPHPAAVAQPKRARAPFVQRMNDAPKSFKVGGWKDILDSGYHNDNPIYIHYTSEAGYRAITAEKTISDKKRGEKREGAKPGIYVNPSNQRFNPQNVETLLFLGNENYIGNGDYVVIFSSDLVLEDLGPVTKDSWVKECKLYGEVKLTQKNAIFGGPNPFPDVFG